jgi:hypothetical protein
VREHEAIVNLQCAIQDRHRVAPEPDDRLNRLIEYFYRP